jgi:rubredoxin
MEQSKKSPTESTTSSPTSSTKPGTAYKVVPLIVECPNCDKEALVIRWEDSAHITHFSLVSGATLLEVGELPLVQCHGCMVRYHIPRFLQ